MVLLRGTASVISSDPPCKFLTVPVKAFTNYVRIIDIVLCVCYCFLTGYF